MNDEFIKDLLKDDELGPKESPNEWSKILRQIESKAEKKSLFFDFRLVSGLIACSVAAIIIYGGNTFDRSGFDSVEESEALNTYFMENTYIDDEQDLYAWADF